MSFQNCHIIIIIAPSYCTPFFLFLLPFGPADVIESLVISVLFISLSMKFIISFHKIFVFTFLSFPDVTGTSGQVLCHFKFRHERVQVSKIRCIRTSLRLFICYIKMDGWTFQQNQVQVLTRIISEICF